LLKQYLKSISNGYFLAIFYICIIQQQRYKFKEMKIKKIKSQNDGFIKVQMAFQEGFEPPTDSLEDI